MRILCAIGRMYCGGSERQMLHLLRHLDRSRYEPELYLISCEGELFTEIPSDVPVHVFEKRCTRRRGFLPDSGFRNRVRDLGEVLDERKIDLIYDRTFHMTLTTAAAVRRRPTPRISTIVSNPRAVFETNPEPFRWIKRRMLHRAYAEADVTACVSEGAMQGAAEYHGVPQDRLAVFHNLFDVEACQAAAQMELEPRFARRTGRSRIVTVGRLHEVKGYDVLIEAFRRMLSAPDAPDAELVVVGNGPLERDLKQQAERAGLGERVLWPGFQPEPLPLTASGDLFVLTSRFEGLPNALIEAMLLGVPVVSTDCRYGPREILEEGRWGGLVPPDDPAALAAAMKGGLDNIDAFRTRAISAQTVISDRFSLATGLKRFDELVDRAVRRFGGKT